MADFLEEVKSNLSKVSEAIEARDKEQQEAKAKELESVKAEIESKTIAFQMQLDGLKREIELKAKEPEKPKELEKPKQIQSTLDDQTQKDLAVLNTLLRIMRGQEDPRTHVTVITNPNLEHLISSSNLTEKQLEAIINMKWISATRPEFQALGNFADMTLKGAISKAGWGTLQGIHLAEAYAPRIAGASSSAAAPEVKKQWYSKKSKEDEKK